MSVQAENKEEMMLHHQEEIIKRSELLAKQGDPEAIHSSNRNPLSLNANRSAPPRSTKRRRSNGKPSTR